MQCQKLSGHIFSVIQKRVHLLLLASVVTVREHGVRIIINVVHKCVIKIRVISCISWKLVYL